MINQESSDFHAVLFEDHPFFDVVARNRNAHFRVFFIHVTANSDIEGKGFLHGTSIPNARDDLEKRGMGGLGRGGLVPAAPPARAARLPRCAQYRTKASGYASASLPILFVYVT